MFIIAAAGTVKALMAVTISLHPGTHHVPASYTVQQGDSLSAIAAHTYGKAADWPAVWWVNRHQVANPNLITAGQRLRLSASGQVPAWMARAAQAAIPAPPPVPAAVSIPQASPPAAAPVSTAAPASSGGANWSAIAACESGGKLERQHRQRLLRWAAIYRADLAWLWRRPVRLVGQPGHQGTADRRGRTGAGRPGHRCLADMRGGRLKPISSHLPAPGINHQAGR